MSKLNKIVIILLIFSITEIFGANPVRIKDITTIEGIRENILMGMGIVTGLGGKGDSRGMIMTQRMFQNLAANYGIDSPAEDIRSNNIAAVMVTARVSGFARAGETIDVTVSAVGDAKSLEGGVLLLTPLKGANGQVYAVAQGRIITGTTAITTGSSPAAAIIEREIVSSFINNNKINIVLKYPDFVTATQIALAVQSINANLKVRVVDAGLVEVELTEQEINNPADFISQYEILTVTPDNTATVVIDKKTGVVVSGGDIVIQPASVSIPGVQISVGSSQNTPNTHSVSSSTVTEFIATLNAAGLNTDTIISLLEAVYRAGAINARLIIL